MSEAAFGDLAMGEWFVFEGRTFVKVAKTMAHDAERHGCIFLDETVVEVGEAGVEGEPAPRSTS